MKKTALVLLTASIFSMPLLVKAENYDDLKSKAKQFLNENGKSSAASKVENTAVEPPKSRFVDTTSKTLSEEDKRHVMVHMKLANRHFSKKNYEKATEEVKTVFTRDPSNSGGHFMLAVIAGRQKDYKSAWYHIDVAKEKDGSNKKIDDFIEKLKTVSKKPESEWIPGIYYGTPIDASERTFDLLESLLNDECSQNICAVEITDFTKEGNNVTLEASFNSLEPMPTDKIVALLKQKNGTGLSEITNSDKSLRVKLTYQNVSNENPKVNPIKGLNDFINDLTEEMPEIAISNTEEAEPANGTQEIIYDLSSREFSSINKFFRQISPFATKYLLQMMTLSYIPGSQSATIWKARIKVIYKL